VNASPTSRVFPTDEWDESAPAPGTDVERLHRILEYVRGQPAALGETLALLAVHGGVIVAEVYGDGTGPNTPLLSWSMAKSVVQAALGVHVREGRLAIGETAPVPEWREAGDPRGGITVEHLLRMVDGLRFVEDYEDATASDALTMLFGAGRSDVAGYAAARPLAHEPGTVFNYSSGTSNILARVVGDLAGGGRVATEVFLRDELFAPIGMHTAEPRFDDTGTFVGSSFLYATARDFARFGLLYGRGGMWRGRPVLPPGWVDLARSPTTRSVPPGEERRYGAHWWLWDDAWGTFGAHGYDGQRVLVVQPLDLVVVRLGRTPTDIVANVDALLAEIIDCFASARVAAPAPPVRFPRPAIAGEETRMAGLDVLDGALEGFGVLNREQAERIVNRLIRDGRLAQERAEEAVEELIRKSKARGEEFAEAVEREVRSQLAAMRAQVASLEDQVTDLMRSAASSLSTQASRGRAAARRVVARGPGGRKAAAKRRGAKKTTAKRSTAKKMTARKSTAKKTTARKTTTKKTAARKTTAKKTAAKKTAARKSTARKPAATKRSTPAKRASRSA
jgi:CubicO group peptidase (beta-lactamase class C family)